MHRELAVVVDGPHVDHWYWRDELEAMQQSAERTGYPPEHPAATFTHYWPADEWIERSASPAVYGRACLHGRRMPALTSDNARCRYQCSSRRSWLG